MIWKEKNTLFIDFESCKIRSSVSSFSGAEQIDCTNVCFINNFGNDEPCELTTFSWQCVSSQAMWSLQNKHSNIFELTIRVCGIWE